MVGSSIKSATGAELQAAAVNKGVTLHISQELPIHSIFRQTPANIVCLQADQRTASRSSHIHLRSKSSSEFEAFHDSQGVVSHDIYFMPADSALVRRSSVEIVKRNLPPPVLCLHDISKSRRLLFFKDVSASAPFSPTTLIVNADVSSPPSLTFVHGLAIVLEGRFQQIVARLPTSHEQAFVSRDLPFRCSTLAVSQNFTHTHPQDLHLHNVRFRVWLRPAEQ